MEELVSPPFPQFFGLQGRDSWTITIQDIRDARIAVGLEDEQIPDATGWDSWNTQTGGSGSQQ